MAVSSASMAKASPLIAPPLFAALATMIEPHGLLRLAAVIVGLIFGALWRAASLRAEGKAWADVRGDLLISTMIGGANAIIALMIVDWWGQGVLMAMGTAMVIGATGVRAVPMARDFAIDLIRSKLPSTERKDEP